MRASKTTCFAAGAVTALVLGSGTALAATGGTFTLGHSNHEGSTSTISNAHGTALSLRSKSGTPSLKVNSRTTVPNLDADLLDGLSSGSFARANAGTTRVYAAGIPTNMEDASAAQKDAIIAVATCPTGTLLTGGGYEDGSESGRVVVDEQSLDAAKPQSWHVLVRIDPTNAADQQATVFAMATCLSLNGPGKASTVQGRTPASALRDVHALTRALRSH